MKNLIRLSVFLMMLVLVATACTNGDQSDKIAALEKRIKELEGQKPATATPTSTAANVEEEKPEGPLPVIQFEEEEYDFGTITAGTVVEHTFKFTNTGEAPLIIQSATASCGCTVPTKPTDPIAVGETGEIGVRYDSKNKQPGIQSPIVTIRANTYPNVTG